VLYLTANPDEQSSLRVDAEVRQVQEAVRGSKLRDNIELLYRPAADLNSIIDGLNDHEPGIVHFSGHGYSGGLAVDHAKVARPKGKILTFDILGKAFAAVDVPPRVVVLNACESAGAKKALLPSISAMIVMRDSVSDVAATAFATRFYAAIAAGQSLKSAFKQGTPSNMPLSMRPTFRSWLRLRASTPLTFTSLRRVANCGGSALNGLTCRWHPCIARRKARPQPRKLLRRSLL
jgi:CHAT domain